MEFRNYYDTMGLQRDASQDEIKRAYRRLARKLHPDVSKEPNAEARFKELGEAYEVLKDPEKRAAYDQLGSDWRAGQDFSPPPDWDPGFEFSGGGYTDGDAAAFSEFFESLFGRGFGQGPQAQAGGGDHHARVEIELEDACRGATRQITLQSREVDEHGQVRLRDRALNVRIPKGVRPGQMIRLSGQGQPARGKAPAGDLYLEVALKPHRLYRVDGRDLYFDLPVTPWEAALGATVKAPTPGGVVDLRIPAGSTSGRKLRLGGRGIPGDPPGDVYAVLRIAIPPADSDNARALYQQMARELDFDPRAGIIR